MYNAIIFYYVLILCAVFSCGYFGVINDGWMDG